MEEEGEKVLYYFMQDGKWNELRTNIFFTIYKYYINNCRLRKILPTENLSKTTLKFETKKIVMANPTNGGLVDNLLPIWTGRELEKSEKSEII